MKQFSLLMVFFAFLGIVNVAKAAGFEARGSALVPVITAKYDAPGNYYATNIFVTNITGSPVDIKITCYDHEGNDVTSNSAVFTGKTTSNSPTLLATGTGSFQLAAGQTCYFQLSMTNTSRFIVGHATIKWDSSDSHLRKAVVAAATRYIRTNEHFSDLYIPVNNGLPF